MVIFSIFVKTPSIVDLPSFIILLIPLVIIVAGFGMDEAFKRVRNKFV